MESVKNILPAESENETEKNQLFPLEHIPPVGWIFKIRSFFIRPISTTGKTDSALTWGCCWVVQEYVYVICSLRQRTDHFTCSPGACGRTNKVEQDQQSGAGRPCLDHRPDNMRGGNQSSLPEWALVVWWAEACTLSRHWGPSTPRLTARWRATWVFKQTHWCCCCCSVAQSCPARCKPLDCSTPSFPVLHYLPEFAQTLVHWVGDAIQPSQSLSSPSPPAFNLSQHQGLFQWVSSSHQVARVLEL